MTVDTQQSLLTYLYDLLTTDGELKAAMSDPLRCYLAWAKPDAAFPYLVHRIDVGPSEPFMMRQATYYLDIWSDSDSAFNEIAPIRKRIIELLDELEPATDEITAGRLWLQTDGFIPETEQGIWHYALQFNLRYYRAQEVAGIMSR